MITRHLTALAVAILTVLATPDVVTTMAAEPGPIASKLEVNNFDRVSAGIWRGARPSDDDIRELSRMGVRTVINLRMSGPAARHEKKVVESNGMNYLHVPLGYLKPSEGKLKKVLAVLSDEKRQPVFIHCRHGADRTGMIVGIYRILFQRWDFTSAYREMKDHHFKPWLLSLKHMVMECQRSSNLVALRDRRLEEATDSGAEDQIAGRKTSGPTL